MSDAATGGGRRRRLTLLPTSRREWIRAGVLVGVFVGLLASILLYFAFVVVPMPGDSWAGDIAPTADDAERGSRGSSGAIMRRSGTTTCRR